MSFVKRILLFAGTVVLSQLFCMYAAAAQTPLKRADVFINQKYSMPIEFDKRLLDRNFRQKIDRQQLKELLRPREVSYVPFQISTTAGPFAVSVHTEVVRDGGAINIDDLPVPCSAYVFFYSSSEGRPPIAMKIVVNNVADEATVRWSRAAPK